MSDAIVLPTRVTCRNICAWCFSRSYPVVVPNGIHLDTSSLRFPSQKSTGALFPFDARLSNRFLRALDQASSSHQRRLDYAMEQPLVEHSPPQDASNAPSSHRSPPEDMPGSNSTRLGLRRNSKRKSSKASVPSLDLPDDLLTAAYEPLVDQEREEWEGWVELESDPASFTHILSELGVAGVQTRELFSLDQDSLDLLPKPVHGLIFLFQYRPEEYQEDETYYSDPVWFANQTSHNACATVALLNIVMNTDGIELGEQLLDFKATTLDLSPPLRGDRITVNSFIRSKHNSFASRLNLLNADLALENEVESAERASKKRAGPKKGKGKGLRRGEDYAFHFIAYVEAKGAVWELDGLKPQPHRLGSTDSLDWTMVARPQIEARMMQYAESQLSFNLLALCKHSRQSQRQRIVESIASLRYLRTQMAPNADFETLVSGEELPLDLTNYEQVAKYGLNQCDFGTSSIPSDVMARLSSPSLQISDAYDIYQSLMSKASDAMTALKADLDATANDRAESCTSKEPWAPAIHKWMEALAKQDALLGIIRNT